ncbi:hypothetical protein BH18ACT2_BH18ACT2_08420 [soil metagenome]
MLRGVGQRRRVLIAALPLIVAGACTGDDETGGTTPSPPVVTAGTDAPRVDDGVLRVGVMAPMTGDGAAIGQSVFAATDAAVAQINAAGGVGGTDVELVPQDEGTTLAAAGDAVEALLGTDVDAVIGPTSSVVALGALGDLLAGGVMACSPTATAQALDEYPGSDRFFRTVPSDTLQAAAIAELAEQTGAPTVAVAFLDDTYGRPLARSTIAALQGRQLAVEVIVPFSSGDEDLAAQATELAESGVGVVVIIGDADEGTRMLSALGEIAGRFEDGALPDVVVNGAMRTPASPALLESLRPQLREQVRGVAPLARPLSAEEAPGLFGTNAVDCLNLIALAAEQAGSDDPVVMAERITEVSSTGVACADFAECVELLGDDRNIDYEGRRGGLDLGADGDPARAVFEVFSFDENGIDQPLRTFPVGG